jgi:hypothetical protein
MFRLISLVPIGFWTGCGRALGLAVLIALALTRFGGEEAGAARIPERDLREPALKPPQFQVGAPAVDFEKDADWLNTEKPLSLADLRGRVVLLDFWTLC